MKETETEATMLYAVLLAILGLFFAALFFFVISARQLHSEGADRKARPIRADRPVPASVVRPAP